MKFNLGQIVQHKISKNKYVLVKYYPVGLFRKYAYYQGEDDKTMGAMYLYESEITALTGGKS